MVAVVARIACTRMSSYESPLCSCSDPGLSVGRAVSTATSHLDLLHTLSWENPKPDMMKFVKPPHLIHVSMLKMGVVE